MMSDIHVGLLARAQNGPWNADVEVMLCTRYGDKTAYVEGIAFKEIEAGGRIPDTGIIRLDRRAAQLLMDDLWNCGMRPTEGAGSAGSLRATEKHLEDMRRLVFKDAK